MRFRRLPFNYITLLLCLFFCRAYSQNISAGMVLGAISNCVGAASSNSTVARFTATGNNLTGGITATAPLGFEVSATAAGVYSNSVTLILPPGSISISGTIYVRAIASNNAGQISGNVALTSPGAFVRVAFLRADINALPTVNTVANKTVVNGANTTDINFSGTAQIYNWTNSDPSIGLAASGSGDILSFTAVNPTASPKIANITVTPRPSGFLYTTNNNSVSVVDIVTAQVVATIPFNKQPTKTIVSPDHKFVYVFSPQDDKISIVSTATNSVIGQWPLPAAYIPYEIELSPDGTKLAVRGLYKTVFYDTATGNILAQPAATSDMPSFFSPDGKFFYAVSANSNKLGFINTTTLTVEGAITLRPGSGVVLSPDGKTLYIAGRLASDGIYVVNTVTRQIVSNISNGSDFSHLSISPNGNRLYATSNNSNKLAIINTATYSIEHTITTDDKPRGTIVSKDNGYVYLTFDQGNTLCVYDALTGIIDKSIPGPPTGLPVLNSDGSRVYLPVPAAGVIQVYNQATKSFFSPIVGAIGAGLSSTSFNHGVLCDGSPKSFTITVNPTSNTSNITGIGSISNLNTTYGTPSASGSFTLSATNLQGNLNVVPPPEFELSTDNVGWGTLSMSFINFGDVPVTKIYIRLRSTANVGPYSGNIVLSSPNTGDVLIPISNCAVGRAPLVIKPDKVIKPYGMVLPGKTGTTGYTVTGLKNGETIGAVTVAYGPAALPNAVVGTYPTSSMVSAASGGTFKASNYDIDYQTGEVEVVAATPPVITITNSPQAVNTVYGTPSASSGFNLSATNLTAAITVVPPAGFELSLDNTTFSNTLNVGAAGTLSPTSIYIRLAAATNVGAHIGDISFSSGSTVNTQNMPLSNVTPAPLTITIGNVNKPYGDELVDGAGGLNVTITGGALKNNQTLTGASYTYGAGKLSTDAVGNYSGAIGVTALTGGNGFSPSNYTVNYNRGNINIVKAILNIQATNNTKLYGTTIPVNQQFTAAGLKNGETVASVNYNYADGILSTSNAGLYTGKIEPSNAVGTFSLNNYTVNYIPGDLVVLQAPLVITANNATRNFGSANPVFTATYAGFVNNENQSQLSSLPVFSTTATITSAGGVYPIVPSGAAAANYAIGYVNGSLTVSPPAQLVIPSAFTPNNDGVNDTWKIPALTAYPDCVVQVFNRNGLKVYNSVGYATEWDGTVNGKTLPTGVYYYIIDTRFFGIKTTGAITLVK